MESAFPLKIYLSSLAWVVIIREWDKYLFFFLNKDSLCFKNPLKPYMLITENLDNTDGQKQPPHSLDFLFIDGDPFSISYCWVLLINLTFNIGMPRTLASSLHSFIFSFSMIILSPTAFKKPCICCEFI